jgi:hypothetical protein
VRPDIEEQPLPGQVDNRVADDGTLGDLHIEIPDVGDRVELTDGGPDPWDRDRRPPHGLGGLGQDRRGPVRINPT